jgi:hypothetical protein
LSLIGPIDCDGIIVGTLTAVLLNLAVLKNHLAQPLRRTK